jgi:capsid assembly protease
MKTYNAIDAFITDSLWLMLPEKLEAMIDVVRSKQAGFTISDEAAEKMTAASKRNRQSRINRSVAVLPVYGVISQKMNMMAAMSGGTSTELLGAEFDALMADGSVDAIVLDIDSPGGNYYGTPELASKIFQARGTKPIVAVANSLAASAAYWIGSAADELVMSPSADVGSIGVLAVHDDCSLANEQAGIKPTYVTYGKHKAETNPDSPLSAEALDHLQAGVDAAGKLFEKSVAVHRGTTAKDVHDHYGQGRCYAAKEAMERSMVDRVNTLEAEVERLTTASRVRRGRRVSMEKRRLDLLAQ